mmetsp:Transcript_12781/g.23796  ORF Transcript_12781/g.23796 Transcript_12781/m.23796 type:complete len:101 (-) Transcript_12781:1675-1977(-)
MDWTQKALLSLVGAGSVPSHLAFIMDGNRRWATTHGKRKTEGHSSGLEKLVEVVEWCVYLGIHVVSVYAFSTDNYSRSPEEVNELFRLMIVASEKLKAKE